MIFVRCPHCSTTFRAEPEQIRQRAGRVRCGECNKAFNALEQRVKPTAPPIVEPTEEVVAVDKVIIAEARPKDTAQEPQETDAPPIEIVEVVAPIEVKQAPVSDAPPEALPKPLPDLPDALPDAPPPPDALQEGRLAGITAARATHEIPGYSRWAEGTLSAPPSFDEPKSTDWLTATLALFLFLMLAAQLTHAYRKDIAAHWPDFRPWLEEACISLNCTVDYPREASLISLDASELSVDSARNNMLVLRLTLKNRAEFAQDYPTLELSLTDLQDNIVVRRNLAPSEYLPPSLEKTPAFAAGSELAANLWIDAKNTGAVGYRLYVFYP